MEHAQAWLRDLGVIDLLHRAAPVAVHGSTDAWIEYFHSVYGAQRTQTIDVRQLRWFWWWAPGSANLTRVETPVWRRTLAGDVWVPGLRMERHLSQAGFFVTPLDEESDSVEQPLSATTRGQTLEVMRVSHPSNEGARAAFGPEAAAIGQIWYWHAPGSGIVLSLGRSLVARNRSTLLSELAMRILPARLPLTIRRMHVEPERGQHLCEGCAPSTETWLDYDVIWPAQEDSRSSPRLCDFVRRAGFDTVQLTAAFGAQRFEIVDCRAAPTPTTEGASATTACPPGDPGVLSAGPHACVCTDSRPFLNCGGCARPATVTRIAQTRPDFQVRAPRQSSS